MPPLVRAAVFLMMAALALYSIGVWATFFSKLLRPSHLVFFWLGFLADTAGTLIMRRLAGGLHWSFHTFTGMVALLLMLAHAAWATVVLARSGESGRRGFYRISVTVWCIWLIPFGTGLYLGYRRGQ